MATPPRELVAAESQQGKKKSKAGSERDSLTGCVDQQDGRYLLLDLKSRDPIANLEAVGFPTEGFAKYVGQQVRVHGTSNSEGARPTIKVRSIETVSDVCAPQQ